MLQKAYDVKVSGKVQRIGYRGFILENAQELGLRGLVRNEADGSVRVFVQGEESLVEEFWKELTNLHGQLSLEALKLNLQT